MTGARPIHSATARASCSPTPLSIQGSSTTPDSSRLARIHLRHRRGLLPSDRAHRSEQSQLSFNFHRKFRRSTDRAAHCDQRELTYRHLHRACERAIGHQRGSEAGDVHDRTRGEPHVSNQVRAGRLEAGPLRLRLAHLVGWSALGAQSHRDPLRATDGAHGARRRRREPELSDHLRLFRAIRSACARADTGADVRPLRAGRSGGRDQYRTGHRQWSNHRPSAGAAREARLRAFRCSMQNTDGEDDLDLYVFRSDGSFVAGSTTFTSEEEVNLPNPQPDRYLVVVHGFETDGPSARFTLFAWSLGDESRKNVSLTAPSAATVNTKALVALHLLESDARREVSRLGGVRRSERNSGTYHAPHRSLTHENRGSCRRNEPRAHEVPACLSRGKFRGRAQARHAACAVGRTEAQREGVSLPRHARRPRCVFCWHRSPARSRAIHVGQP